MAAFIQVMHSSWSDFFPGRERRNWVGWEGQFLLRFKILFEPTLLSLEPGRLVSIKILSARFYDVESFGCFHVRNHTLKITSLTWNKIHRK